MPTTRKRGNEASHSRVAVTIERAKIDCVRGAASRAAYPQKPIPGGDRGADRRREQHRHALDLALIPGCDQALSVLKHLGIGRAARGRFLLDGGHDPGMGFNRRKLEDRRRHANGCPSQLGLRSTRRPNVAPTEAA